MTNAQSTFLCQLSALTIEWKLFKRLNQRDTELDLLFRQVFNSFYQILALVLCELCTQCAKPIHKCQY